MKSGIYTITNTTNNKVYVGRAQDVPKRLRTHRYALKYNRHHNSYLQRAYNLAPDSFIFEILEFYPKELIIDMEQYWMNMLQAADKKFGYNIDPSAYTNTSGSFAQETKDKIRAHHTGRKQSPETIARRVASIKKLPKRKYIPKTGVQTILNFPEGYIVYDSVSQVAIKYNIPIHRVARIKTHNYPSYIKEIGAVITFGPNLRKSKSK